MTNDKGQVDKTCSEFQIFGYQMIEPWMDLIGSYVHRLY